MVWIFKIIIFAKASIIHYLNLILGSFKNKIN